MKVTDHSQELNYFRRRIGELERELAGSPPPAHSDTGQELDSDALRAENKRLLGQIERCRRDPFDWLIHSSVQAPATLRFLYPAEAGLVSAIIPAFRGTDFLRTCLDSVWQQQQEGPESLEIILCDDGCPQGTGQLAAELSRNSRIPFTIVSHPGAANRGVAATRNLAMAHSRGEFLALLDVDDEWLPQKTRTQTAYLRARPKATSVCSYAECIGLNGRSAMGWSGTSLAGFFGSQVSSHSFEDLLDSDPVINSTVMMKRSAVEEAGGYTDVMAHQAEDWLLFQKLAIDTPMELIPAALARYRVHANSYTSQYVAQGFDAGVRWETHMQLLHWLLQQPRRREIAQKVYRKYTPKLLASYGAKFRSLENSLASGQLGSNPDSVSRVPSSWRGRVLNRWAKSPGRPTLPGNLGRVGG